MHVKYVTCEWWTKTDRSFRNYRFFCPFIDTHIDPTPNVHGSNKKIVETSRISLKVPMRLTVHRPGSNIWADLWFQLKINNIAEEERGGLADEEEERRRERAMIEERPRRVRDKDFRVEEKGEKKLSALTDSRVEPRGLSEGKKDAQERGKNEERRKTTVFRFFPSSDAPSRLVRFISSLSPVPVLPFLFSLCFSLTLRHNLRSTPDPMSYLYDICVHYLAQGVHRTAISSRHESCRVVAREKTEEESASAFFICEREINPATSQRDELHRSSRVRGRIIPPASLPSARPLCSGGRYAEK